VRAELAKMMPEQAFSAVGYAGACPLDPMKKARKSSVGTQWRCPARLRGATTELERGAQALAAEIDERRAAEQALHDTIRLTRLQLAAVGDVGQAEELLTGDVEGLARKLTELAASAIGCERVNVWLFDDSETSLHCIDLFEATPARHSAGLVLKESEYRREFQALKGARYVDAHDALTDPRTAGYVETYVKPLRITSMLDTVIQVSGKHLGLLCFEHVDRPHRWEQHEISFAGHLADKLALALFSRRRRQAEEELRASESRFKSIYNSVSDAIFVHDVATGAILDVNARATEMFGFARAEILARDVGALSAGTQPYTQAEALHRMSSTAAPGSQSFEWYFRAGDGRYFWGEVSLRRAEFGAKEVVLATVRDVSERKRQGDELRASEARFRMLVEQAPEAILVYDCDQGRLVEANTNAGILFGCSRDELLQRGPLHYYAPHQVDGRAAADCDAEYRERALKGEGVTFERRIRRPGGGEDVVCEVRLTRLPTAAGHLLRASFIDVTQRRLAEDQLRFANTLLASEIESTPDGVLVIEVEPGRVSFNRKYLDMWKLSAETARRMGPDETLEAMLQQLRDPEEFRAEMIRFRHNPESAIHREIDLADGRVFECHTGAMQGSAGRALGQIAFFRDVTERRRAAEALRESRQLLEGILNAMPVRVFWKDSALNILGCNAAFARDAGFDDPKDAIGKDDYQMAWREQADLYRADDRRILEGGAPKLLIEEPQTTAAGTRVTLLTSKLPLRRSTGEVYGLLGMYMDISDRKRMEDELRTSESRFRAVSETAQDAIIMIDAAGKVGYWNPAATRILGYAREEMMGRDVHALLTPSRYRGRADEGMKGFAATGRGGAIGKTLELAAVRKDGVEIPVELSVASMRLGEEWHAVAILRDITERKQADERIRMMARRDFLTGLANRAEFVERLQEEIARADRNQTGFAILYLDLDHFKDVNDTLGHPIGDSLLQSVGQRLSSVVREADIVARFGGDEFAIIEVDAREPSDAASLANKVLEKLREPFSIQGNDIHIGASIGIDMYGRARPSAETLLSHADVALYRAKSEGRDDYRFFTEEMDGEVRERVALARDLREGMARGEFFLMYQPQVDIETGQIKTFEALVRWRHPSRGLVSPAGFIDAAEKSGLIVPLGHWILHEACRQTKEWLDAGLAPPRIAVNLSAVQLKTPRALEQEIHAILAKTGLPAELLELELTESVLLDSSPERRGVLLRLRDKGVRIALDDFGTGYSSLGYLSDFPIDLIKIAQTFMLDLRVKSGNAAIVRAAIGLANELGLQVVVEGVETKEQLKMITSWGARVVQGYCFSKPVSAAEVSALLHQGKMTPRH
jgi:diguanylate cyclase (GGDEF)-like protein/PAS domain S-box-containing protein